MSSRTLVAGGRRRLKHLALARARPEQSRLEQSRPGPRPQLECRIACPWAAPGWQVDRSNVRNARVIVLPRSRRSVATLHIPIRGLVTHCPAMPAELHKRPAAPSNDSAACSDVTSAEPKKEKKKKKKRTQDHEVCAGTGTLDQLFLAFLFMTVCLFVAVLYLWKVRLFSPCALLPCHKCLQCLAALDSQRSRCAQVGSNAKQVSRLPVACTCWSRTNVSTSRKTGCCETIKAKAISF